MAAARRGKVNRSTLGAAQATTLKANAKPRGTTKGTAEPTAGTETAARTEAIAGRGPTTKAPAKQPDWKQGAAIAAPDKQSPVEKAGKKPAAKHGTAKRSASKKAVAKKSAANKRAAKQTRVSGRAPSKRAPANGRKGRPVDADSALTRQSIIDAATWVFGMQGYEGASMQNIAERTGITAPTLYHYFASKAEIFRTVGDDVTAEFRLRTDAATAAEEGARQCIAAILRVLGEWIVERPEIASFIASYAAEVARNKEVRRLSPAERWTDPMEYYARFAREGLERGEIAEDLDPETVAGLIQGLIYGMSALVAVGRSFGPPDRIVAAFARAIDGTVFVDP